MKKKYNRSRNRFIQACPDLFGRNPIESWSGFDSAKLTAGQPRYKIIAAAPLDKQRDANTSRSLLQSNFIISNILFVLLILGIILSVLINSNCIYAQALKRDYWPTDGWKSSAPEAQGLDPAKLSVAVEFIENRLPDAYSLLVVKNGYLVFEKYFRQGSPSRMSTVHSATKSIMSALIGIAFDRGFLRDTDQKIIEFFREYFAGDFDPRKNEISLKHLLTMSAGFKWNDWSPILWDWMYSPNWGQYAIQRPLESNPGDVFNYNSSLSHLLSIILSKSTRTRTQDFADKHLFKPLGIKQFVWERDPQAYNTGGFGLLLTARDLAKFGFLYLNHGYWNGQPIVPKHWMKESTRQHMYVNNVYGPTGYGYHWWVKTVDSCDSYRALGRRGQFIVVVPELDLVIVVTSETEQPHPPTSVHYSPLFDLVAKAVKRERPTKMPLIAAALPPDVESLISRYNQAVSNMSVTDIPELISDRFLVDGASKQMFMGFLSSTISYMSNSIIVPTMFELQGDIAKIDGVIKDKYFETPFTPAAMLIKEEGLWKLYGNQLPKKN